MIFLPHKADVYIGVRTRDHKQVASVKNLLIDGKNVRLAAKDAWDCQSYLIILKHHVKLALAAVAF